MRLFKKISLVNYGFAFAALLAILWFLLPQSFYEFFSSRNFMPHGHCYLWKPSLVWTMVSTNFLIGAAYVSIAACLYVLVKRISLPFSAMFLAFGAFIFACGGTHFVAIYTLWIPDYWTAALVNVVTAMASVATAILIFPVLPKVTEVARSAKLSEARKDELERANLELERRTRELEDLNRELEAFSYSVSHDLRAPLRGMDGFSQAIMEDYSEVLDEDGKRYLRHIREGTQNMGRIIDDLLNLARLSRVELKYETVDLSAIAQGIVSNLQRNDPHRKVKVTVHDQLLARGDAGLLSLVLENLLSNSWKFTAKQEDARIELGSTMKEGESVFFVKDNGAGFDMVYANKLFGVFQRLHTMQEFPGTGVGLATVKRILQRHGGSIWAESEVGKGATFFFALGGEVNENGR